MQEACEFGESRDAEANRLSDEIHANRTEITRAGRRPQAIGADAVRGTDPAGEFFKSRRAVVAERNECVPFKLDWCTAWVNVERLCKCPITQVRYRLLDVLCDAPQNTGWVKQYEAAHLPIPVSGWLCSYCISLGNLFGLNLRPPGVHVFHE